MFIWLKNKKQIMRNAVGFVFKSMFQNAKSRFFVLILFGVIYVLFLSSISIIDGQNLVNKLSVFSNADAQISSPPLCVDGGTMLNDSFYQESATDYKLISCSPFGVDKFGPQRCMYCRDVTYCQDLLSCRSGVWVMKEKCNVIKVEKQCYYWDLGTCSSDSDCPSDRCRQSICAATTDTLGAVCIQDPKFTPPSDCFDYQYKTQCVTYPWEDRGCGESAGSISCLSNERLQIRTVEPPACADTARCVLDPACGPAKTLYFDISPDVVDVYRGNAVGFTARVDIRNGSFSGDIDINSIGCPTGATCTNTRLYFDGDQYYLEAPIYVNIGTSTPLGLNFLTAKASTTHQVSWVKDTDSSQLNVLENPYNLTAITSCSGTSPRIILFWNTISGASYYNVSRQPSSGGSGWGWVTTGLTSTNYTDTNVVSGTNYQYYVQTVSTTPDRGGIIIASNKISVLAPSCTLVPSSYVIFPTSTSRTIGQTQQFTGLYDPDGPSGAQPQQNVTNQASWNSSNTNVATINNSGLATCRSSDSTIITSVYQGLMATANLSCVSLSQPPPPLSQTHLECNSSNQCVSSFGPGPNRCSKDEDCGINGSTFAGKCVDQDIDGDGLPENYCVNQKCDPNIPGDCVNSCRNDLDCKTFGTQTHFECYNNACVIVGGFGQNNCFRIGQGCRRNIREIIPRLNPPSIKEFLQALVSGIIFIR